MRRENMQRRFSLSPDYYTGIDPFILLLIVHILVDVIPKNEKKNLFSLDTGRF